MLTGVGIHYGIEAANRSTASRGYLDMKQPKLKLGPDGKSWRIDRRPR